MIQRKQSIWLLLSSLFILLSLYIPYGVHTESALTITAITETDLTAKLSMLSLCLSIAASVFSFFLIFLYSNRKLQMNLCLLAILLCASVLGLQIYTATQTASGNKIVVGILGSKIYLGLFVAPIAIGFAALAYLGIRNDEKLIRSADRLR